MCGAETVLSSFLPFKQQSDNTRTVAVQIRRLDDVLPELVAEIESPRIFLKMDTQGFDSQVLDGASACIDQIVGMQSEISVIPIYDGMLPYTDSLSHYERLGFALMDLFPVNRTPEGCVMEYDCVMARTRELV